MHPSRATGPPDLFTYWLNRFLESAMPEDVQAIANLGGPEGLKPVTEALRAFVARDLEKNPCVATRLDLGGTIAQFADGTQARLNGVAGLTRPRDNGFPVTGLNNHNRDVPQSPPVAITGVNYKW